MTATLFDPIQLGAISAPNRVFMSPLTRGRSSAGHVPVSELKAVYYSQRASAGLIIAEATGISQEGLGWPSAPGVWSDAQVAAWKPVTEAVHEAGGRIILQLWHMGRLVHPDFLGGAQPVSASATTAPGDAHTAEGKKPYTEARALETAEIPRIVEDYVHAAKNAMAAGFDGVQIHAANGYLIDQFLRDNSNFRTDQYGGPIENRIRLLREVTQAVVNAVGSDRTSVRLSPNGETQGADDSNPVALFTAAAAALQDIGIAFLELREIKPYGNFGRTDVPRISPHIREVFKGPLVLNQEYTRELADADLSSGLADAISFGRPYIGNPDLVERLRVGAELTPDNFKTWYSPGAEGYTDYPLLESADA
ncbi:alkene reductase [Sphingorhabdus sp. IMCC26285]|uniref:Alkene reductase n=1 Tax=Sphingorhabdus profundilacus TaxID=2509718 RepID=A0A6I4M2G2_9SPHN|nr:alkene reductase [Sphingorhabdus profundilacus]MVZ98366.1 alkene reductase [Sphingorhabdus profundilacus]